MEQRLDLRQDLGPVPAIIVGKPDDIAFDHGEPRIAGPGQAALRSDPLDWQAGKLRQNLGQHVGRVLVDDDDLGDGHGLALERGQQAPQGLDAAYGADHHREGQVSERTSSPGWREAGSRKP